MTSCIKTTEHRFWTTRIEAYNRSLMKAIAAMILCAALGRETTRLGAPALYFCGLAEDWELQAGRAG